MTSRRTLTLSKIRSALYWFARVLGDVNAVRRGTVGKRVARRLAGKGTGRLLRRLINSTPVLQSVTESDAPL